MTQVEAGVGEMGMTQLEVEAGEVGMTQVEAEGEVEEVMAVAVDVWAASRGVVETRHNGGLVRLALAKCLPWLINCHMYPKFVLVFLNLWLNYVPQGF